MIEPWMHRDQLIDVLLRRGESSAHAFEIAERVAIITADRVPELTAIEQVLGYVPSPVREEIADREARR